MKFVYFRRSQVVFLVMLQAGPFYGAFLFFIYFRNKAVVSIIYLPLGAYSTIKVSMLTFEVGFLGLKFSLLRALVTLPVFIINGYLIKWYLKTRNFEVKQP